MDQSEEKHPIRTIGENDSDMEDPSVDLQSPTQSKQADQDGVTDHTADVETPCKSETHEPNVEKHKDSLVQTEENVSKRQDMNKFVTRQTSAKRRRGRLYVRYSIRYTLLHQIKNL